ncbi:hypothetical protein GV68_17320 [Pseudorhizobium pelagicum]|uniref:Uncharacterized protein n=1 Tax=Pseudorhizobium pelagicum TaxID=1509405 RepID=A0A922NXQ2_9HYPH|nr:hypothetical protein GV68_17320 [Pseudorhizobium pelagicum]
MMIDAGNCLPPVVEWRHKLTDRLQERLPVASTAIWRREAAVNHHHHHEASGGETLGYAHAPAVFGADERRAVKASGAVLAFTAR